jgi:hypothetical protein
LWSPVRVSPNGRMAMAAKITERWSTASTALWVVHGRGQGLAGHVDESSDAQRGVLFEGSFEPDPDGSIDGRLQGLRGLVCAGRGTASGPSPARCRQITAPADRLGQ